MNIKYNKKVYTDKNELKQALIDELDIQNYHAKEVQKEIHEKIEEIDKKYQPEKEYSDGILVRVVKLVLRRIVDRIDKRVSLYGMQWASEWSKGVFEGNFEMIVKVFKDIKKVNKKIYKETRRKDLKELFKEEDLKEICGESKDAKNEVIEFLTYIENFLYAHEQRNETMMRNLKGMEKLMEIDQKLSRRRDRSEQNHSEDENE